MLIENEEISGIIKLEKIDLEFSLRLFSFSCVGRIPLLCISQKQGKVIDKTPEFTIIL